MLARAIGGISEGNVQLSMCVGAVFDSPSKPKFHNFSAILSDVSTPATRGKALSLVGIAFGLCFIVCVRVQWKLFKQITKVLLRSVLH